MRQDRNSGRVQMSGRAVPDWKWERVGRRAALIHFLGSEGCGRAAAVARVLQRERPGSLRDATAAFEKLLVEFGSRGDLEALMNQLKPWLAAVPAGNEGASMVHVIPVRYDGEDLADVARHSNLAPEEVIQRHLAPEYTVALLGFSPGFPYLEGLDPALHTPRRGMPRVRMPAGAVAIGGSHTGVYSLPTPGGWNWIGNTDVVLFDPSATENPGHGVLLRTGDRVRFVRQR
jgi:KipI family sensor histidine kinase inhibitor